MSQIVYQVDAFTDKPFGGNPAAVCILDEPRDAVWMQNFAMEMNLSETAYLERSEDGFNLRWFTPRVEVDLCGHATLASAHILWETGVLPRGQEARFHTQSGLLTATQSGDWIELNFPANPARPAKAPALLVEALKIVPLFTGESKFDFLIEVDSEEAVRNLSPNFSMLHTLDVRGIIVTSRAKTPGYDFVTRFFAPGAGIDEDPVTGSACCTLGPYWSERLGKNDFVAYQASKRGGIVRVRVAGDRVLLQGQAVTVMRGELMHL
jgi:PhzF family phenazine biosynthesis protein